MDKTGNQTLLPPRLSKAGPKQNQQKHTRVDVAQGHGGKRKDNTSHFQMLAFAFLPTRPLSRAPCKGELGAQSLARPRCKSLRAAVNGPTGLGYETRAN